MAVVKIFGYLKKNVRKTVLFYPSYPNLHKSPTMNKQDWVDYNRRSHTGILLYVNSAPITWMSKRQSLVQTSTHGAELIATRMAVELIESLRYKLRMFGVHIDGPTLVYCDNNSVVHNSHRPESTLKKKHNSISFHKIREAVAADVVEIHKVGTTDNLADILTKPLNGVRTQLLCNKLLLQSD